MRSILIAVACLICHVAISQKTFDYPLASKEPVVNVYHTDSIIDPYQWMENPEDTRLSEWLAEQENLSVKQQRQQVRIHDLKAQIFSMYRDSHQETTDDYVEKEKVDKSKYVFDFSYSRYNEPPDLLYKIKDVNEFSTLVKTRKFKRKKDDKVVITNYSVNKEDDLLFVELSFNGSDWREGYFFNLSTAEQLPDTLKNLRIGSNIVWHERGVYYDSYQEPAKGRELLDIAKGQTLYYHEVGANPASDKKLYQNIDTTGTQGFHYGKLDSTRLVLYHTQISGKETFSAISLVSTDRDMPFSMNNFLIYPFSDSLNFRVNMIINDTAYLKTNWAAPNGKVMIADVNQLNKLYELVPEFDVTLRNVYRLGRDKISCIYRNEGKFLVLIYNSKGELLKRIDFPEGKKVNGFYEYDPEAEYTVFTLSSFYHPAISYQLSLKDLSFKPIVKIQVPFDVEELETRYVKYKSKDGTEVPMYITCLKNTKLNGENPVLLYAYGGYGITVEPKYERSTALWLLHGGVLAIPGIRGGGAEGSKWSESGRGLNKQNGIDDFIYAAKYLIEQGYTNKNKLAIKGGSHGGMLVAAAAVQNPDLFKAVIAEAGVYDLIRFEEFTIGSMGINEREFGSTSDPEEYENLKAYSPLHNLKVGTKYPNILLLTGDNDDRVPALHSYKFLAALQEKGSSESLYQLYIVPGAGHGGALTPEAWINKELFTQYFLFDQLGLKFW